MRGQPRPLYFLYVPKHGGVVVSDDAGLPAAVLRGSRGTKVIIGEKSPTGGEEERSLGPSFLKIHESCHSMGATLQNFMCFLHTYQSVLLHKREGLRKQQDRLQAGIGKLNEATALVDELKTKAAAQRSLLAVKQSEADEALEQITASMSTASERKSEMEVIKGKQSEERAKLETRKKAIDIELSEIEPLVAQAKKAVGSIKPATLGTPRTAHN